MTANTGPVFTQPAQPIPAPEPAAAQPIPEAAQPLPEAPEPELITLAQLSFTEII